MAPVSIPVPLDELRAEIERLGRVAYFLTVGADGRPHCVAQTVEWSGDRLVVAPGNTTVRNAAERPLASLLWPAPGPGEYSLIVYATVTATRALGDGNNSVTIEPTRAVFHRPAADGGHDCVQVYSSGESRDVVDEQGVESFPASDPPSNWAGED